MRDGTPPQRPSSPSAKSCDGENVTVLPVKYVNRWLGAGRNLHKEAEAQRPSTDHKPGWLIDRPQTMGSLLHTSRTVHTCQHLHSKLASLIAVNIYIESYCNRSQYSHLRNQLL